MSVPKRRTLRPGLGTPLHLVIFSAVVCLYVILRIDSRLIRHRLMDETLGFSRTWDHFVHLLTRPGGFVAYVAGHLFQWYVYPWAGALVIAALLLAVTLATLLLVQTKPGSWWRLAYFIPAIALLVLVNQYDNALVVGLGLLAALLAATAYLHVGQGGPWHRAAIQVALAAAVYWVAGWAPALSVTLFCGIAEFRRRRRVAALVCLGAAVAVGCVAVALDVGGPVWAGLREAMDRWEGIGRVFRAGGRVTFTGVAVVIAAFYVFVAVSGASARGGVRAYRDTRSGPRHSMPPATVKRGARKNRSARRKAARDGHAGPHSSEQVRWLRKPAVRWLLQTLLLLAVAAGVIGSLFREDRKLLLQVDYCFQRGMWMQVLSAARRLPVERHNLVVAHDVNRALYHTGRLPYDMFLYPQHAESLLLERPMEQADPASQGVMCAGIVGTYYELGRLNDAEHWAHEFLQLAGDYPWVFRMLARINIVKGQPEAARVFLRHFVALRSDIEGETWAGNCLRRLDADPQCSADDEVRRLRTWMPTSDVATSRWSEERLLTALLKDNRNNRMAFEYLMAFYLLTGQVGKVAENLHRLDDFDYQGIPRLYEEALLVHYNQGGAKVDLGGREISAAATERFEHFVTLCRSTNPYARRTAMASLTGSYFEYCYWLIHTRRTER